MKLSVKDRLMGTNILPSQGVDVLVLWTIKELSAKLQLAPAEREQIKLRAENDRLVWDGELDADIPLTTAEVAVMHKALMDMNEKKTLTVDHLDLYAKFVGMPPSQGA
jgi:hypothetical protein